MSFNVAPSVLAADAVQRLLNLGLFYSLTNKRTGDPVSHHHTLSAAMQAKTRKTRVVLTRKLLIGNYNNG